MRARVTGAAKRALHAAGHYARALAARRFPGIAVLAYHGVLRDDVDRQRVPFASLHVSAATLDAHLALIARHCTPMTLAEAEAAWRGDRPLPERGVLVTFDDGHRALLELALPRLEKHGVPATVFACTGPIERQRSFWFDAVARAEGETAVEAAKQWDGAAWRALVDRHDAAPAPDDPVAPLTNEELARLAASQLVTLGAHTVSHPILARAEREVQDAEIAGSRDAVARLTGRTPTAFAYPNGRPGVDFDATTRALLAAHGFTCAFTTAEGFAPVGGPALERPRYMMLDSVTDAELAHRMAHSWT